MKIFPEVEYKGTMDKNTIIYAKNINPNLEEHVFVGDNLNRYLNSKCSHNPQLELFNAGICKQPLKDFPAAQSKYQEHLGQK